MPRSNLIRIGGIVVLIGAYACRQRGLFIVYHLLKAFALLGGRR
jgi:hypothetical protein